MTEDEILHELEAMRLFDGPEDAYTTDELCDMLGLEAQAVRRRLKVAKKAGRLEVVDIQRERLDGLPSRTRGYRILPASTL